MDFICDTDALIEVLKRSFVCRFVVSFAEDVVGILYYIV